MAQKTTAVAQKTTAGAQKTMMIVWENEMTTGRLRRVGPDHGGIGRFWRMNRRDIVDARFSNKQRINRDAIAPDGVKKMAAKQSREGVES